MDYELSDAHKLIRDTARRIARERIAPRAAAIDEEGEYPHDIFAVFREAGFTGLTIPPEYGGSGAGFLAMALAVEETAKYCCASGLMISCSRLSPPSPSSSAGRRTRSGPGSPARRRGETKGAFCLTEPNAGSDAAALESRARRDGDDYVLDGEKAFISGGSVADFVVAFARVGRPGRPEAPSRPSSSPPRTPASRWPAWTERWA